MSDVPEASKPGCGCSGGAKNRKTGKTGKTGKTNRRVPRASRGGGYSISKSLGNMWNNTKSGFKTGFSKFGSLFKRNKNVPGSTIEIAPATAAPSLVSKSRRRSSKSARGSRRSRRSRLNVKP